MTHDPFRAKQRIRLGDRDPLGERAMRVLAVVHLYPPEHNAGAELMLHTMLRDLVRRGWDARVVATSYRGPAYDRDGVSVMAAPIDRHMVEQFTWCDVAVTHLDATRRAIAWARWGRPLVHVVHNHRQLYFHRVTHRQSDLVVWNSEWVKRCHPDWAGQPSLVVRPPVYSGDYATKHETNVKRGRATLLNLYGPKGSPTFWRLVDALPDHRFLGVRGSYGNQDVPARVPRNATVIDNTPDVVEDVYRRTRVLLVPSRYESWGRVAVEAMASGIPVIANPTPGLREALTSSTLGGCALFVDDADSRGWVEALRSLDDKRRYDEWSKRSRARSAELDVQADRDLDEFEHAMRLLATAERTYDASMANQRTHDPFAPHSGAVSRPRRSTVDEPPVEPVPKTAADVTAWLVDETVDDSTRQSRAVAALDAERQYPSTRKTVLAAIAVVLGDDAVAVPSG